MPKHDPKTIDDICEVVGIARRTYFLWRSQAPGFPPTSSPPAERIAWLRAYKGERSDQKAGVGGDDEDTNWKLEKLKWDARKAQQAVESERMKIVLEARDEIITGIAEVLESLQRRVQKVTRGDRDLAERLNVEIERAVAELLEIKDSD